mgnify:CR=1 FL=1
MKGVIIQARLGSTRFPKKILRKLGNESIIEHVVTRTLRSKLSNKVIVITPSDGTLSKIKENLGSFDIEYFEGSEQDVLSRYYYAAKNFNIDHICRITSDCPLIDPQLIDNCWEKYDMEGQNCYVSNTCPPGEATYPDGQDIEIFPFSYLEKAHFEIQDPTRREHVTFQFWQDNTYTSKQYKSDIDYSDIRLTVDYLDDLKNLEILSEKIGKKEIKTLSYEEICSYILNNKLEEFLKPELRNKGWKNEN